MGNQAGAYVTTAIAFAVVWGVSEMFESPGVGLIVGLLAAAVVFSLFGQAAQPQQPPPAQRQDPPEAKLR